MHSSRELCAQLTIEYLPTAQDRQRPNITQSNKKGGKNFCDFQPRLTASDDSVNPDTEFPFGTSTLLGKNHLYRIAMKVQYVQKVQLKLQVASPTMQRTTKTTTTNRLRIKIKISFDYREK